MSPEADQERRVFSRCLSCAGLDASTADDALQLAFARAVATVEGSSLGTAAARQLRHQAKTADITRARERLAMLQGQDSPTAGRQATAQADGSMNIAAHPGEDA